MTERSALVFIGADLVARVAYSIVRRGAERASEGVRAVDRRGDDLFIGRLLANGRCVECGEETAGFGRGWARG